MGFKKGWDIDILYQEVRKISAAVRDRHNDGWTASGCKYDLYQLKCFIDDVYRDLPTFLDEEKWEQQRLVDIIKRQ
jgi:cell division septum initiation protein DivIVA